MKKAIFIYNPISGDRSIPNKMDNIIGAFQDNGVLIQPYRILDEDRGKLVRTLKHGKYEFAIVSGGDGTLNNAINLILKSNLNLPVGIIPSGTCNDFARCLNLPSSLQDCIDIILAGNTIDVDVGLINERHYFLSTCAGGVFVDISFNTHNELKKNFGPFAYYLKAISEVANIKSFKVKLETPEQTIEEEILLFLILNGKGAAGFSNLIKEADITDGLMDIMLIKNCSHIDLAGLFFKVLTNENLDDRNVTIIKTAKCIITGNRGIDLSIDGEKGMRLPISVRFINKALKVFVG